MKTLPSALAFISMAILPLANAQSNLPMVTAATLSSGKKGVTTITSDGFIEGHVGQSIGVSVKWRYFRAPTEPCELQCFFVAKHDSNKARYVYDVATRQTTEIGGEVQFLAQPLLSSGLKWADIPFAGTITGSNPTKTARIDGTLTLTSAVPGSKLEGWIVRAVSGGQVVRIISNQSHLESLAKEIPEKLDAIAAKRKKK